MSDELRLPEARLNEWGERGQERLAEAAVLVVGAGALGLPASAYLAAAGLGQIGIVDPAVIEPSAISRQTLLVARDVGEGKAERAAARLSQLSPELRADPYPAILDESNPMQIATGYDVAIDATSDPRTGAALSDACFALRIALVIARLDGLVAWVGTVSPGEGACYRCLVDGQEPGADETRKAVTPGPLAGVAGSLAALEAVKLLVGLGEPLAGERLVLDARRNSFERVTATRRANCDRCGAAEAAIATAEPVEERSGARA